VFKKPIRKIIFSLLFIVIFVFLVALIYFAWAAYAGNGEKTVNVVVLPGQSLDSLIPELSAKGVLRSADAFRIYIHLHKAPLLKPGVYELHSPSNFGQVISDLSSNPREYEITVIPGMTLKQIALLFNELPGYSAQGFLNALNSPGLTSPYEPSSTHNLEGLLGADTYFIYPKESYFQIIDEMIKDFEIQAKRAGLSPSTKSGSLDSYQLITVASIIEREAKYITDKYKVARVIYNRLSLNMNLDMDSTIDYALGNPKTGVTKSDIENLISPYNTYKVAGLPPTPIASVNADDIKSALSPASGSWLYFVVVTSDGHEAFSTTYQGQLNNEKLAQSRGLG
jgi:UPF0755 protein